MRFHSYLAWDSYNLVKYMHCFFSFILFNLMCQGVSGCQMRALDSLELELQVFVSLLGWVLGTDIRHPHTHTYTHNSMYSYLPRHLSSLEGTIVKLG